MKTVTLEIPDGYELRFPSTKTVPTDMLKIALDNWYGKPLDQVVTPKGYRRVDYRVGKKGETIISWSVPHTAEVLKNDNLTACHFILEPDTVERYINVFTAGHPDGWAISTKLYVTESEAIAIPK